MHKIIDKLTEELYEYENKAEDLSAGDVEMIYKLASSVKNLHKIKEMEDGGYSEATDFMGEGRMYGTSYARGRRYAKRDSMGRYSRDDGYSSAYDRGSSYDGRGGYTHDGYSRADSKEHMLGKLESMMHEADSEQDRKAIRMCMQKIEKA